MLPLCVGDAGLSDRFQLRDQRCQRASLAAGDREIAMLEALANLAVVEEREAGLAVGRAMKRKHLADRRDGAQAMAAGDLIDKDQMVLAEDGKVDRLPGPLRQRLQT